MSRPDAYLNRFRNKGRLSLGASRLSIHHRCKEAHHKTDNHLNAERAKIGCHPLLPIQTPMLHNGCPPRRAKAGSTSPPSGRAAHHLTPPPGTCQPKRRHDRPRPWPRIAAGAVARFSGTVPGTSNGSGGMLTLCLCVSMRQRSMLTPTGWACHPRRWAIGRSILIIVSSPFPPFPPFAVYPPRRAFSASSALKAVRRWILIIVSSPFPPGYTIGIHSPERGPA